ncbi:hypothetical protein [Chryseosolibacter indicus]|uniref:Uncharacterized protein n=1 Tax=Chryseosolibacter indicus TaxID=2782351 RepID=A0ABS5VTW4_9BACT|nr:hypothetical protein [Chryseosolibacter indicus]MBT1704853.1 hypothetical protein [Chryseosolibacter indicus]
MTGRERSESTMRAPCQHRACGMSARNYPYFSQTRCSHGAGMVLAGFIPKLFISHVWEVQTGYDLLKVPQMVLLIQIVWLKG